MPRCRWSWLSLAMVLGACAEKKPEPLKALAPAPLPSIAEPGDGGTLADREAIYRVEPAPVFGEPLPEQALTLTLDAHLARSSQAVVDLDAPGARESLSTLLASTKSVLLTPVGATYLAQVTGLLALLDDLKVQVLWRHPVEAVAYPVVLRDEEAFRAWLDEAKPGKVRIIQRADGFEVQTNVGKLPGADPNGPTVPLRGGQLDLSTLRRGLTKLKERFTVTEDVCFVPSFGTELRAVTAAFSSNYRAASAPVFRQLCLVYPRPAPSKK